MPEASWSASMVRMLYALFRHWALPIAWPVTGNLLLSSSQVMHASAALSSQEIVAFRRGGLTIGEFYFDDPGPHDFRGIDLLRVGSVLLPHEQRTWRRLYTLVLDLTCSEGDLLAQM